MKPKSFRGRIALWSAAVATAALVLFGVATAWNLRRELVENLDRQIQDEGADFAAEMDEMQVQSSARREGDDVFERRSAAFPVRRSASARASVFSIAHRL